MQGKQSVCSTALQEGGEAEEMSKCILGVRRAFQIDNQRRAPRFKPRHRVNLRQKPDHVTASLGG